MIKKDILTELNRTREIMGLELLKEQEDMIQGISTNLLHPNTIDFMNSQQKITTQMLLKIIAGCTENGPLERFYFGSLAGSRSDNRAGKNKLMTTTDDGTLYLSSPNGQHIHVWDNLCGFTNNSSNQWTRLEGWPTYEKQRTAIITSYLKNWVDSLQNGVYGEQLDAKTDNRYTKGGQQLTWKSVGNDQWGLSKKG